MRAITVGIRALGQWASGLSRPTLLDVDGLGAGAISPEDEVQRSGAAGLFDDGRRTGIAEERIHGSVSGVRQPAQGVAGAEQDTGGATMRTEQGSLVQACDPTGATHGKIISGSRLAQAQASMEQRGVIRLRVIRSLGDEDDGIDGRGIQAHLGQ